MAGDAKSSGIQDFDLPLQLEDIFTHTHFLSVLPGGVLREITFAKSLKITALFTPIIFSAQTP